MSSHVYPTAFNNPPPPAADYEIETSVPRSRRRTHSRTSPEPEIVALSSQPQQQHPSRRRSSDGPLVRTGPIMFALIFCCTVPLVVIQITTSSSVVVRSSQNQQHFDLYSILLSSSSQQSRLSRWMNPQYTISNNRTAFEMVDYVQRRRCDVHSIRQTTRSDQQQHPAPPPKEGGVPLLADTTTTTTTDWIFVENDHQVMIAVVIVPKRSPSDEKIVKERRKKSKLQPQWIFRYQESYAIPGSRWMSPITATCSNDQPFATANATMAGLLLGETSHQPVLPIEYDDHHIPMGNIPPNHSSIIYLSHGGKNNEYELHWKFLGRYRNHADYGGGFTFTYLLRIEVEQNEMEDGEDVNTSSNWLFRHSQIPIHRYQDPESLATIRLPSSLATRTTTTTTTTLAPLPLTSVLIQMSTLQVEEALEQGQLFSEIRGAATIGLALHHL